jgi:hydrogenase nickel incorporation protein HypA/HybF
VSIFVTCYKHRTDHLLLHPGLFLLTGTRPLAYEPLMHEQSIVASILNLAIENAKKADARKIVSINLVVGDYTGVVEDAVSFYFGFLSKNTIAAGAKINYTHIAGQLRCRDCDILFPLQKRNYQCPKCEGKRVEIVGGRELYIENMEVE